MHRHTTDQNTQAHNNTHTHTQAQNKKNSTRSRLWCCTQCGPWRCLHRCLHRCLRRCSRRAVHTHRALALSHRHYRSTLRPLPSLDATSAVEEGALARMACVGAALRIGPGQLQRGGLMAVGSTPFVEARRAKGACRRAQTGWAAPPRRHQPSCACPACSPARLLRRSGACARIRQGSAGWRACGWPLGGPQLGASRREHPQVPACARVARAQGQSQRGA